MNSGEKIWKYLREHPEKIESRNKKISEKLKGKPPNKGSFKKNHQVSEQVRKKLSDTMSQPERIKKSLIYLPHPTGENHPLFGISPSLETREKISNSLKEYYKINPSKKRVDKILRICKICGKKFYVYPSAIKQGRGTFCSRTCLAHFSRKKQATGKNKLEEKLNMFFRRYGLDFEYVGDGSVIINGHNPDFIDSSGTAIIEVFGDYWHGKDLTNRTKEEEENYRIKLFSEVGIETKIFWEHEINSFSDIQLLERIYGKL